MNCRVITLIGMPGAGKTTLGKQLASTLDIAFIDTDHVLEQQQHASLQHILEKVGPLALRKMEGEVVLAMPFVDSVIATGGSMVYSQPAMERLQTQSLCIYLRARLETLTLRLGNLSQRGFASPGLALAEVLTERHPLYLHYAHCIIDIDGKTEQECLMELMASLKNC